MSLTLDRCLEAISQHSRGLAASAREDLSVPVESCPGWTQADLVWHLIEVHWFWRTIAGERLAEPPGQERRPERPTDDALVATLESGARALVDTLRDADQSAACWTWYPLQQDVAFITRHQVQEAAVHHWDAAHAAGARLVIEPDIAVDSIEEFLTTSLADADDVARIGRSLDGFLVLHATDADRTWTVSQADPAAALTWAEGPAQPTVSGSACDLLLWLYGRAPLEESDPDLVGRFRALASTD